ncbi:MAG TPA: hypothetical protein PLW44_03675 [Chitinophagales bacterium]|nr:hypothetical protein [Chitinophagales bacterium]
MKKTLTLFVLLLSLAQGMYAQVAYKDAQLLSTYLKPISGETDKFEFDPAKRDEVLGLLKKYTAETELAKVNTHFELNPFTNDYLNYTFAAEDNTLATAKNVIPAIKSMGGLDVTMIADGIAKWMVARSKEELNATFFQRFKKEIEKPQYEDFRILFPRTTQRLSDIGEQIYNYSIYLTDLQKDFANDLTGVLENFPRLIDSEKYRTFFNDNPDIYAILHSSLYLFNCIKNGNTPAQIVNDLPVGQYFSKVDVLSKTQNVKASIQTLQLISKSFANTNDEIYWVSADEILESINNQNTFRIYLGLIAEQAEGINFYDVKNNTSKNLKDLMFANVGEIGQYDAFIRGFVYNIRDVQQSLHTILSKPAGTKAEPDEFYQLYNSIISTVEVAAKVRQMPFLNLPKFEELDHYIAGAKSVGNLYTDVKAKNYVSIVLDLVVIYDNLIQPAIDKRSEKIKTIVANKSYNDPIVLRYMYKHSFEQPQDALKALAKEKKTNYYDKLVSGIMRYGSFMAAVSRAKNSDEVKLAIEAVALPVGSSSVKKTTGFTISVNTYVAPSFGAEFLKNKVPLHGANGDIVDENGNPTNDPSKYAYHDTTYQSKTMGIYAPVGIGFNWALTPRNGNGGSISLFVPLLDLGAFVTYRFKDDTTTLKESVRVRLKDIFAPGICFIYGIPKVPLSIGFSCNWAPSLSAVYADKVDIRDSKGYRLHGFIGVDIPAVHIFASKEKRRK